VARGWNAAAPLETDSKRRRILKRCESERRHRSISRILVHPHACGDDFKVGGFRLFHLGSPPRVWGRRAASTFLRSRQRFTPTRVGTTSAYRWLTISTAVHPHACGDDESGDDCHLSDDGSPPRVWGRPGLARHRGEFAAVHPHACGDDPLWG